MAGVQGEWRQAAHENARYFGVFLLGGVVVVKLPPDDVGIHARPRDVFTNPDAINERTYIGEPECFVDGECEDLEYEATLQRFLPLGIDATIYFHTHIRWVESDWGPVFVQQRWLTDTPEVSVDWIHLNHGYSFAVTIPWVDDDDATGVL